MNDNLNIEQLANWSAPELQNDGYMLRQGRAGSAFWDSWKVNKPALQAAGVSCRKLDGAWFCFWELPADAAALVPAAAVQESVKWSAEQEAIFDFFANGQGNLVVEALAGTGKTTTIKKAFSFAKEDKMLYAVFNAKNRREAQEKITDFRVAVHSLHSLGYYFIKLVWNNVKPHDYVENDRLEAAAGEPMPDDVFGQAKQLLGFAKNTFLVVPSVDEVIALAADFEVSVEGVVGWNDTRLAKLVIRAMELSMVRDPQNRISFDDMVFLPVAMNWVRPQFKLVVIDEAQDMNAAQLELAMRACAKGGRIVVVGDSHQAIYGFRGAVSNGMNMMKERLQAKSLGLTVTYRCPQLVVAKAQQLVSAYKAAPEAPKGEINEMNYNSLLGAVKIGDAVLSRLNAPLMPLCLKCLRNGVAARIEGRDVGASLNSIVRKLRAKSIPHLIEKLENWGDKMKSRAAKSKNADAKIEAINDQVLTLTSLAEGCTGLDELQHRITSMFEDSDRNPKPAVVFSSVHKAKGLEWQNVYTLSNTFNMKFGDPEEEKNIQYVAWTRTKNLLVEVYID